MGAVCLEGRDSGGVTRVGTRLFDQEPGVGEGLARHGPDALAGPAHRDRHDPPAAAGGIREGMRGDVDARGRGGWGHARGWGTLLCGSACGMGGGLRVCGERANGQGHIPRRGTSPAWRGTSPAGRGTSP